MFETLQPPGNRSGRLLGSLPKGIPQACKIDVFVDAASNPRILVQRRGRLPQMLQPTVLESRLRQESNFP